MSKRKVAICEVMSLTDALSLERQLRAGDEQLRAVGECHTGRTPWEAALPPEVVLTELGGKVAIIFCKGQLVTRNLLGRLLVGVCSYQGPLCSEIFLRHS